MADTPTGQIDTRASVATKKQTAGFIQSYISENLLSDPIPVARGRRFMTCWGMSDNFDLYSKASDSGGK